MAQGEFEFNTVFGRNLVTELGGFVHPPFLVVTMADLWPIFRDRLPGGVAVHLVESMEEAALDEAAHSFGDIQAFIGLGGGQAIDAAKYFSWRRRRSLFQVPTSLSVDAVFGHRAGVRRGGQVHYVGWAVPDCVFIDYEVIAAAPRPTNRAGVGDVLCFYTGILDWRHAIERGQAEPRWPYRQNLVDISMAKVEAILAHQTEIRDMTEIGVEALVDGLKWGGASYCASGWCPRHIEGFEHFFFYALEYRTGRKFLHGQPVALGVVIGTRLHDKRAEEFLGAIHTIGIDIRPEAMGLSWEDVTSTLYGLSSYVREAGLWYGIAHDAKIDAAFVNELRADIEALYGPWSASPCDS